MKNKLLFVLFIFLFGNTYAQNNIWNTTSELRVGTLQKMIRESVPTESKLFRLDFIKLKQLLANAPQDSQNSLSNLIIEFPNPEGELIQYRIYEAPVMEKELADKYPDLKSYSGSNVTNPSETIRFSVTLDCASFPRTVLRLVCILNSCC